MFNGYLNHLKRINFDKNQAQINNENHTGVELILVFYTVILFLNVIGQVFSGSNIFSNPRLQAQIIYIAAALLLYFFVLRKSQKTNYTLWIYLIETPMLMITMIFSTIQEPHDLTFTFLFFLMLFPLLILDKPWRISLYVIAMSVVYAIVDSAYKDPSIFTRDMLHLFNVDLMTISASFYFLSVRIRNIEYADYFAEKADTDPLTGLYNRAGARKYIHPELPGVFIYIDLDYFKQVNDQNGHEEGDRVIVATAEVLRSSFRSRDIVVRLGGDEFAVFAPGRWTKQQIEAKLSSLLSNIHTIKSTSEESGHITASIGCAFAPNGAQSLEQLVHVADQTMYTSKENGKDQFSVAEI